MKTSNLSIIVAITLVLLIVWSANNANPDNSHSNIPTGGAFVHPPAPMSRMQFTLPMSSSLT